MQSEWSFEVGLPRHAFSVRDAARAGDVWRAMQEVAVEGSSRAGWPPGRYRETGSAFVMRSMTVVHDREAIYGETLHAKTWVRRFRRGIFSTRGIRIASDRGDIARRSQEWVHVHAEKDGEGILQLAAARAPASLSDAFPVVDLDPDSVPAMPALEAGEADGTPAANTGFEFQVWHTWMDPLAHVNHPAYLDWADESVSRAMADAGMDPAELVPVAEKVSYSKGMVAGESAWVRTRRVGRVSADQLVFDDEIGCGDTTCATVRTVRRSAAGGFIQLLSST